MRRNLKLQKLITRQHILDFSKSGASVYYIAPKTTITPLAADTAKDLGIRFEPAKQDSSDDWLKEKFINVYPARVVAVASDHGGFALKQELVTYLRSQEYIAHDLGPANDRPCDYPDYAFKVAGAVAEGKADRGIMIDSIGIGSAMAANRVPGILAAKCNNIMEAHSAREHNYANVLTLGAKIIGVDMAKEITRIFLETPGGAERHVKRIKKILRYQS